ncbi:TetR/AcrR family transcriptional regulator [Streptomyces dysideae]|nr:TetR/AcrR family transcriptional regulator [Streptomyces dysideae]
MDSAAATGTRKPQNRRGSYAVGQVRRERILNAALLEFAERGYRGTSMARIAERCEISETGLRHHFGTKDELLVEILRERDRIENERRESEGSPQGVAGLEDTVRIVDHNSRTTELTRLFTVLTGEAVTDGHPAAPWAVRRYRDLRRTTADSLRGGVASGELRPDIDADRIARQVIAVMDGLQLQWLLDPESIDMAADFRAYIDDLVDSLRTR